MRIAGIAITENGIKILKDISKCIDIDIYQGRRLSEKGFLSINDITREIFNKYDAIIYTVALGAVVRIISRYIKNKYTDPGIIVIDDAGRFTISLLSGHRIANNLSVIISKCINNQPVITTASEANNVESIEEIIKNKNIIVNGNIASISYDIISGKNILLIDECNSNLRFPDNVKENIDDFHGRIIITRRDIKPGLNDLILLKRDLCIGIGFSSDADYNNLFNAVDAALRSINASFNAIKRIATIDIKSGSAPLNDLIKKIKCDAIFYKNEELNSTGIINGDVYKYIGAYSVSTASAYLSSNHGKMLIEKMVFKNVTVSIFSDNDENK
ncbi:cobalt-precorrin 5A hydrolase [Picrophilus oshimae]|uniref:Cobalamin biosynthesis protein CbiG n=1 Tax=Picrophilus torridus (strain ATCC 700027 / DSM 9790 / JCM 10055 / NBRC 100828 / KAW 2/3) TaxID=1122961 RepID=Q6L2V7_PICTO|nr:cobalamin biosynthesis protein [Picrophilus oshimae]AAT42694.1 cobalamin biosynthesis protein CbiG [Picrophilus oshimae DSM 9789]